MKNNLTDLNNYLFESLERLLDDDMTEEEMQKEIKRSEAVTSVAAVIIHNGELALKAAKYAAEYGVGLDGRKDQALPPMLEAK